MSNNIASLFKSAKEWRLPRDGRKITAIDAHTAGEPLRIIVDGFPALPGNSILAKRRYAKEHFDQIRTALMWEPRGHADMYGCIVTPPVTKEADFGVLFIHNEGFSTMCGHGIIGVTTVLIEMGAIAATVPEKTVKIDTPAGLVTATARLNDKRVESVSFLNVPSFVLHRDQIVDLPGSGKIRLDVAFGGAFYAYVEARDAKISCKPENYRQLIEKGMAIKKAVIESLPIRHPFESDLNFLYGTIFIEPAHSGSANSRNVCIFADGELDRSPTGTGVSGRMALHHARGEIQIGEKRVIESIIGTRFIGSVAETTRIGSLPAVIPRVEGSAYITGKNELYLDSNDPLKNGFFLR